jgi:hypothetical protein
MKSYNFCLEHFLFLRTLNERCGPADLISIVKLKIILAPKMDDIL